jgi:uncharacterized membrane protein YhdT
VAIVVGVGIQGLGPGCRREGRPMTRRIVYFAERVLIALGLAAALGLTPLPRWTPAMLFNVQIPLIILLLICYMGKLIIDTFFYDRHP